MIALAAFPASLLSLCRQIKALTAIHQDKETLYFAPARIEIIPGGNEDFVLNIVLRSPVNQLI